MTAVSLCTQSMDARDQAESADVKVRHLGACQTARKVTSEPVNQYMPASYVSRKASKRAGDERLSSFRGDYAREYHPEKVRTDNSHHTVHWWPAEGVTMKPKASRPIP